MSCPSPVFGSESSAPERVLSSDPLSYIDRVVSEPDSVCLAEGKNPYSFAIHENDLHEIDGHCSKVDPCPDPAHDCVGNPTSTTGPDDVLQVGLEDQCAPEKPEAVGQLKRRLISPHSDGGIRLPRAPLRVLQIIAKVTGNHAEAAPVRRPRREKAADEEASGGKERHLTDGLVGRDESRAGDAETAVAARLAEPNQHLVEQAIEATVTSSDARGVAARDGVEVGELAVIVPTSHLVVADQTLVARETVALVPSLPNGEEWPIHRPVQAVVLIVADGGVAVIQAALHVRPRGGPPHDETTPRGVG